MLKYATINIFAQEYMTKEAVHITKEAVHIELLLDEN